MTRGLRLPAAGRCFCCALVFLFSGISSKPAGASERPMFATEPPSVLDFSNDTGGRLDCTADGDPKPTVGWSYVDGKPVADVRGLRRVLSNGSLAFGAFAAQDYRQDVHATVYRCRASNAHGTIASRDVRVRAVVLQTYEAQVYDDFVIKGNTAVLKCHIPTFVVDYVTVTSWQRDGAFVYPSLEEGAKYAMMPTGELHISDVQPEDGDPVYRCYTKHRLTREERPSAAAGRLFVSYPIGSVQPRITDSKVSVVAKEGGVAVLPCVAQSHPLPKITWFVKKDDEAPVRVTFDRKYRRLSGGLRIDGVSLRDAGVYACVANNSVGSEKAETTLIVTAPLSVRVQPERKVADLGRPASFRCVASGAPVVSLTWLKNGRPLNGDRGVRRGTDVLQFPSVRREDRGVYQCLVSGETDSAQGSAELQLGDIAPSLLYGFPENVVHPGAAVSLQCVASGSPPPDVRWILDGAPLTASRRLSVENRVDPSGKLVALLNVSAVGTEDGGHYACEMSNKAGSVRHASRLNVYGRPFVRALPPISTVAGRDVTITCPASGYPLSSVTWERGGRALPTSHHQVAFPNGTLQIKSVQRALDAGKYTCVARNDQGQMASRDLEVMILVPPHIIPFSFMDEYMLEGMLARITCVVGRGDLPLAFAWIKDGRPIASDLGVTVRTFDEHSVVLTIDSVTSKHNGNYTCIATNPAGSANHTAQLVVNVPPRWVVEPEDADALAGHRVALHCQVEGFPVPTIQWMKAVDDRPGEYKIPFADDADVRRYDNGSLVIDRARASHAGRYLCRASNGIGAPLGMVVKVHVRVPVHFEVSSQNQTARRGERTTLRCEARGEPPIRISWLMNGGPIDFESSSRLNHREMAQTAGMASEIDILRTDRRDTATYVCVATNKYGRDEQRLRLTVTETPEAPVHLKVSDKTSRSVTLSWAAPFNGNSHIVKYVVQCKPTSVSWLEKSVNFTVPGGETTVTVPHLQPAANYHVRLFAVNGLGIGEPSDVIAVATLEEAPAGPPLDVKAESVGTDAIKVIWKPPKPDLWNGQILGYYVGYRLYETSDPFTFATVDTSVHSLDNVDVDLTGLKKFTRYAVVVQAFNHVGTSPRSDEIVVLTSEDVPSMPPEQVQCSALSSQSLHVTWNPIPSSSTNGVLQGYKVVYGPVEEWYDQGPEVKITASPKTVLSGLEKYTNYSIQVLGFTRIGDGIKSAPVYCTTNEDVPEAPADVKVAAVSSNAALVAWKRPIRPNGNITKYTIYKRTTDDLGKQDFEKYVVPPDLLHYETDGLKKGWRYEFWITASTSFGEGQSTRVVAQSAVGAVVPAKIVSFGGQLNVSWKSPLTLPCKVVGVPSPEREWKFRGQAIRSSDRTFVGGDGDLVVRSTRVTDAGTYSCEARNGFGSDEISYLVRIRVPPPPPVLAVSAATFHGLEVRWRHELEDDIPVTGYYLHYKRDFGEWERVFVEADRKSFLLTNLDCGTRYHLYILAANRIGEGTPSEVVTTRTEGAAPTMPRKHAFVRESATFVTLHLDAWISGCAILYFVVHYKMRSDTSWRLVSNNVLLQQKEFVIPDLHPATWYQLQVTAHNNAGSTVADYTFATLTATGGVLPELAVGVRTDESVPFYYNVTTMVVSVGCLVLTLVLIVIVCVCCRRKIVRSAHETIDLPPPGMESRPRLSSETVKNVSNSSSNYLLSNSNRRLVKPGILDTPSSDLSRDISPYATSQLPGCYARDSRTLNQRLSPHVYPPLRELQEIRDGTYPGTRKTTLQRLQQQQCSRLDSHYSIGYPSSVNSSEDVPVALTGAPDFGSQPWSSPLRAPSIVEQNVPDLLDHGPESNSSAVSSPDANGGRSPRCYRRHLKRKSGDLGFDFMTQETSFTFLPPPEITTLQYRPETEFSDTESELDHLHRKKFGGFGRMDGPLGSIKATLP